MVQVLCFSLAIVDAILPKLVRGVFWRYPMAIATAFLVNKSY